MCHNTRDETILEFRMTGRHWNSCFLLPVKLYDLLMLQGAYRDGNKV